MPGAKKGTTTQSVTPSLPSSTPLPSFVYKTVMHPSDPFRPLSSRFSQNSSLILESQLLFFSFVSFFYIRPTTVMPQTRIDKAFGLDFPDHKRADFSGSGNSNNGKEEDCGGLQIIGAGLPRCGTTSLKAALEILGFGECHHMIVGLLLFSFLFSLFLFVCFFARGRGGGRGEGRESGCCVYVCGRGWCAG